MILSKMEEELRHIAHSIDEHGRLGRPYDLTFYHDAEEPLTDSQMKKLDTYLKYHFHDIWADTWLHIESDRIRKAIGDLPIWRK